MNSFKAWINRFVLCYFCSNGDVIYCTLFVQAGRFPVSYMLQCVYTCSKQIKFIAPRLLKKVIKLFTCKIYVQERGMLFMYVHICRMNKVKSCIFRIKLPINVLILIVISFRMEHCLQFLTSVKRCLDSLPVKQRTSFAQKGSLIPHTQENFTKCRV